MCRTSCVVPCSIYLIFVFFICLSVYILVSNHNSSTLEVINSWKTDKSLIKRTTNYESHTEEHDEFVSSEKIQMRGGISNILTVKGVSRDIDSLMTNIGGISGNVLRKFSHPSMVSFDIMRKEFDACKSLYGMACGNWKGGFNRMFVSTMNENANDMALIQAYMMSGSMTPFGNRLIGSSAYSSHDYPTQHSRPVKHSKDHFNPNLYLLTESCASHYSSIKDFQQKLFSIEEKEVTDSSDSFIAKFHREWTTFVSGMKGSKHIIDRVAELVSIVDELHNKTDLASTLAELDKKGVRGPLSISSREGVYQGNMTLIKSLEITGIMSREAPEFLAAFVVIFGADSTPEKKHTLENILDMLVPAYGIERFLERSKITGSTHTQHDSDHSNTYVKFVTSKNIINDRHIGSLFPVSRFNPLDLWKGNSSIHDMPPVTYVPASEYIYHLDWIIGHFDLEEWKQYLIIRIYDSVIGALPDIAGLAFRISKMDIMEIYNGEQRFTPKNYIRSRIKSAMKSLVYYSYHDEARFRSSIEDMCAKATMHVFPISYCKVFIAMDPESNERHNKAREISENIKTAYMNMISAFDLTSAQVNQERQKSLLVSTAESEKINLWCTSNENEKRKLVAHIDKVKVVIGECSLCSSSTRDKCVHGNAYVRLKKEEVSIKVIRDDYGKTISAILGNEIYKMYRPHWIDFPDRETVRYDKSSYDTKGEFAYDQMTDAGAWYLPATHTINIPPGMLRPPFFSSLYDDTSMYATFGYELAHEYTHATEALVYNTKVFVDTAWRNSCQIRQLSEAIELYRGPKAPFKSGLGLAYETSWYAIHTFYENRADWIGINVAYEAWRIALSGKGITEMKTPKAFDDLFVQFFTVYAQVWCADTPREEASDIIRQGQGADVHAMSFHRVDRIINMLPYDVKERYKRLMCNLHGK